MYILYTGPGGKYASAAVSRRVGPKNKTDYTYLGTVIDKERGIYKNKERGFFTFDVKTGEFGEIPEDYTVPVLPESRGIRSKSVDFGDAYLVNAFLYQSGLMSIIDTISFHNKDTLHAMVIFYILSDMANCDAIQWYKGSIAQWLCPNANLTSQRISDFLSRVGSTEEILSFQKAYIDLVLGYYSKDHNVLIDSCGLPNDAHFTLTQRNVHDGKVSTEIRLAFVVQQGTGLPLFYWAVPGNIVDMSTLSRIFLYLDSLGIKVDSCIMDAGYNTAENLDLFYTEDHQCKIEYITRIKSNDKQYQAMISEELATIQQKENFVQYGDRYVFIISREVLVGQNKDNPAWMYLGLDCDRLSDELHKLLKRARKKSLSKDDVFEAMENEGVFGLISSKEYTNEELLPAYYQRQTAEQTFDFCKNYTKLLPIRCWNEETFQGHLLLSYIASCAVKMIQLKLKDAGLPLGSRLKWVRNQKATVFTNRLVVDTPEPEYREIYKALGLKCIDQIPIQDGILLYKSPAIKVKALPEAAAKSEKKASKEPQSKKTTETKLPEESSEPKKRGRPKGSKNKMTLAREAQERELAATQPKRGRGRPKGSKNKKTLEREARLARSAAKRVAASKQQ